MKYTVTITSTASLSSMYPFQQRFNTAKTEVEVEANCKEEACSIAERNFWRGRDDDKRNDDRTVETESQEA